MSEPTPIAAFDFDGTISLRDSLKDFARFSVGPFRCMYAYLRVAPKALLWGLGLESRQAVKCAFLRFCWKGMQRSRLEDLAEQYANTRLPRLIRAEMLERLKAHKQSGHILVLVSASPSLYLKHWAHDAGFDAVLATELAFSNDVFEGDLASPNCWGPEKVSRLSLWLQAPDFSLAYAYGDSRGDQEMLARAQHPWLRGRDAALPALAR